MSDACPTSANTAIISRIIPSTKCLGLQSSFCNITTMVIPAKVANIPNKFSPVIFSLKNRTPTLTEKIGTEAIITALIVGEPVS